MFTRQQAPKDDICVFYYNLNDMCIKRQMFRYLIHTDPYIPILSFFL